MTIYFMPQFIADLQDHGDANFAKRVLQKTVMADGSFRPDNNDHRYQGMDNAWIRYVSRRNTAYRIIFIRRADDIFFYRAGEHDVENRLAPPHIDLRQAIPMGQGGIDGGPEAGAEIVPPAALPAAPPLNRLYTNILPQQIQNKILSRRNLPHIEIWFISPFINFELLTPMTAMGNLLFSQIEDGAKVRVITAVPKDQDLEWCERISASGIEIFFFPKLHTKLYAFLFDESRRSMRALQGVRNLGSMALIGSSNLTFAGLAVGDGQCNEELCYTVPSDEIGHVEEYIIRLTLHAYDLPALRLAKASGQWSKLERPKW